MDIVIWISIAPLYKTTSKFFHVKFFIVPLKLLDTLHKHGYNVECKIVWCRSRVLKIHRIGLQGFKPQSIISKEKYFSFRLWRKDSPKWGISPKDWRARRKICNDGLERYVWKIYWNYMSKNMSKRLSERNFRGLRNVQSVRKPTNSTNTTNSANSVNTINTEKPTKPLKTSNQTNTTKRTTKKTKNETQKIIAPKSASRCYISGCAARIYNDVGNRAALL